jgi:hypothetical protein
MYLFNFVVVKNQIPPAAGWPKPLFALGDQRAPVCFAGCADYFRAWLMVRTLPPDSLPFNAARI